ncbi:MAG: hypothetical protein WAN50_01205 [Minisyncoccia bacterium]
MTEEFTNLLPIERRNALSRDYVLRLCTVAVWFLTALTLAAMVLLLPTYTLLAENASTQQAHLASIEAAMSSGDESSLAARVSALNANAAALSALANAPSASATLRSVLGVAHAGVSLNELSYTPAKGKGAGTVAISGTAATRDALRAYQLALSGASFAHAVDLPVSAYAQDTAIPFTITVTLTP